MAICWVNANVESQIKASKHTNERTYTNTSCYGFKDERTHTNAPHCGMTRAFA